MTQGGGKRCCVMKFCRWSLAFLAVLSWPHSLLRTWLREPMSSRPPLKRGHPYLFVLHRQHSLRWGGSDYRRDARQLMCRSSASPTPFAFWTLGKFTASLPYGVGNFRGTVTGAETRAYRSGMLDSSYRLSVNLKGGPAMDVHDFLKWRQRTLLGVSIKVVGSDRPIRPNETDQLRCQPLGLQARARPVSTMGALGARHLRSCVVFHHEPRLLLA